MVDKPEAVSVSVTGNSAEGYMIKFVTDKNDIGKIIGKRGRMARAFRLLVNAMGLTSKTKISLDISG